MQIQAMDHAKHQHTYVSVWSTMPSVFVGRVSAVLLQSI